MDQGRTVDAEELSRAMEDSRVSISETVCELRDVVHQATDWREYVKTYPAASLGIAAGTGLVLGRWVGGRIVGSDGRRHPRVADDAGSWTRPTHPTSLGASSQGRMLDGSMHRAANRAESLVNRVIDEVADAVEAGALVPLFSRLRDFLYASASPARRSEEGPTASRRSQEWQRAESNPRAESSPGPRSEEWDYAEAERGRSASTGDTRGVIPGTSAGATSGASAGRGVTPGAPAGWAANPATGPVK